MAKFTTAAGQLLSHYFLNADVPNLGDATGLRGSVTVGSVFLALHTAIPAVGGNQSSNEATYTGYARVAVPRTAAWFSVSGNALTLVQDVDFPVRTDAGATQTLTYCSVGVALSGATVGLYFGLLAVAQTIDQNDFPRILAGQVITES